MGSSSMGTFCLVSLFSRESCRISHSILPYLCPQRNLQDTLSQDLCPETGRTSHSAPVSVPKDPQNLTLCPISVPTEKGIREASRYLKKRNILKKIEENFIKQLPREMPTSVSHQDMGKDQGYKLCPAGISCLMEIKGDKKPK